MVILYGEAYFERREDLLLCYRRVPPSLQERLPPPIDIYAPLEIFHRKIKPLTMTIRVRIHSHINIKLVLSYPDYDKKVPEKPSKGFRFQTCY